VLFTKPLKTFGKSSEYKKQVPKMKPNPIPELEGRTAREFEKKIREPPTQVQKQILKEAAIVYKQMKRRTK